ncbi:MAG: T9SS type A sorting domain-containing protein, partial [Parabacteroides sp.]|nr:T9SS type A sorting domain-containing protein [Parabacteroides sp.]MBQ8530752.1 T9SS type A sorting domain-containing protein [Parabacteroides sp.]
VFTTSGTLVRSLQPNQSVHTFDLSQGLYLIRAVTDGMVKTEKVLVR